MTRIFNGTTANDTFVGDLLDINIFNSLGIGSDRAVGGALNDRFLMRVDRNTDFVDGGRGRDTIDYSASGVALNINLSTGETHADLSGGVNPLLQDVTVTRMANIEDVVGSRFADTIIGSAQDNRLDGGAGNDLIRAGAGNDILIGGSGNNMLDGGTGTDTADYSTANHSIFAQMSNGAASQVDFETGTVFSQDSLSNIENITGSRFGDYLSGTTGDNVINGGDGDDGLSGHGGNDTIHGGDGDDGISANASTETETASLFGDAGNDSIDGGAGNDLLDGGTGNDYLFGFRGNDTLLGGEGNDRLEGSIGADSMDGGSGVNTLMYRFSQQGVTINLANQTASGGDAAGDTFSNIQNVWGSQLGNDVLIGSSGNNVFFEQGGDNLLVGNGGHDTFAFMPMFDGRSVVLDFRVGDDRLAFVEVDGMADLNFTQVSNGTLVTYDNDVGSVLLLGVNTQDLLQHAATDIVFSDLNPLFGV